MLILLVMLLYTTGDDADKLSFVTKNSGNNLEISDFTSTSDYFEFSSAAFNGNDGHVLVFGTVQDQRAGVNEFLPNNTRWKYYCF